MFILDGVPFVASTYEEAWKLMELQDPYFKGLFDKAGMVIAGYQVWPSQGFYTKTPVNSVEDFKGKKIRIYSTATQKMATLLGFNATILPFAEIPQAFSTGLIEALFTSAQTGVDIQAWDNTKYFTDVGAILSKNALIFSKRAFSALSPADQKVVMDAAAAYTKRSWEMSKAAGDEKAAYACFTVAIEKDPEHTGAQRRLRLRQSRDERAAEAAKPATPIADTLKGLFSWGKKG